MLQSRNRVASLDGGKFGAKRVIGSAFFIGLSRGGLLGQPNNLLMPTFCPLK